MFFGLEAVGLDRQTPTQQHQDAPGRQINNRHQQRITAVGLLGKIDLGQGRAAGDESHQDHHRERAAFDQRIGRRKQPDVVEVQ